MVRVERQHDDWFGIAAAAVGGLAAGLAVGVLIGETLGDLSPGRLKGAIGRLKPGHQLEPEDPRILRRAVEMALDDNIDLHDLVVDVTAHEDGFVELTGIVPDPLVRELAGEIARDVPGAHVVVNRLLVEGIDVAEKTT